MSSFGVRTIERICSIRCQVSTSRSQPSSLMSVKAVVIRHTSFAMLVAVSPDVLDRPCDLCIL